MADGSNKKTLFEGLYCDRDNYKTVSGISFVKSVDANNNKVASASFGSVDDHAKTYGGIILYSYKSDTSKYFAYALCIEDK